MWATETLDEAVKKCGVWFRGRVLGRKSGEKEN